MDGKEKQPEQCKEGYWAAYEEYVFAFEKKRKQSFSFWALR